MMLDWKTLRAIIATAGAVLVLGVAYMQLGLPIYATRGWVDDRMRPWILYQLKTRRLAVDSARYQWAKENPRPFSPSVEAIIKDFTDEMASIDKQIVELERQ